MSDAAQLIAACLVEQARHSNNAGEFRGPLKALLRETCEEFGIKYDPAQFQIAQEMLESLTALEFHLHDGMEAYCVVSSKEFDLQFHKTLQVPLYRMRSQNGRYDALESYAYIGRPWLQDALDTYLREPFKRVEMWSDTDAASIKIPASDRVVSIDHNSSEAQAVAAALEQLETELVQSNEAFVENGGVREAAVAEASALRRIWSASVVRIDSFKVRATQVLAWVADRAATATVSEMCKRLVQLILNW